MTFALSKRTLKNIEGIHPTLIELAHRVIRRTGVDFCVLSGGGKRSGQQAANFAARGTGVKNSRHLTGDAIDFVVWKDGRPTWKEEDIPDYNELMDCVYEQADEMGLLFIHGADWNANGKRCEPGTKEYDWPHIQRPWPYQKARAEAARERRMDERREKETDPAPAVKDTEGFKLSPDITPGLSPEDMNDADFDTSDGMTG